MHVYVLFGREINLAGKSMLPLFLMYRKYGAAYDIRQRIGALIHSVLIVLPVEIHGPRSVAIFIHDTKYMVRWIAATCSTSLRRPCAVCSAVVIPWFTGRGPCPPRRLIDPGSAPRQSSSVSPPPAALTWGPWAASVSSQEKHRRGRGGSHTTEWVVGETQPPEPALSVAAQFLPTLRPRHTLTWHSTWQYAGTDPGFRCSAGCGRSLRRQRQYVTGYDLFNFWHRRTPGSMTDAGLKLDC